MNTERPLTMIALFILLCGGLAIANPSVKTVAYTPAYGPTYNSNDDYLKQILEELKGLRRDVQSLKAGQQPSTQDGATSILATRCLSCHQDGKAQEKGGNFVLVEKDGTLAELSLAEKRRIIRMVQKGEMPPTGKLPDSEVKSLTEFFTPKTEEKK